MDLHPWWAVAGVGSALAGGSVGLAVAGLHPRLRGLTPGLMALAVACAMAALDATGPALAGAVVALSVGEILWAAGRTAAKPPLRGGGVALLAVGWGLARVASPRDIAGVGAVAALPAIGAGVTVCAKRWPQWALAVVIAGAAAATWVCVPDTEVAVLQLAAAAVAAVCCVAMAATAQAPERPDITTMGWWAIVAVWLVGVDSGAVGRPAAAIGAMASAGVLMIWPLAHAARRLRHARAIRPWSLAVIATAAALGLWSSRVAGLTDDARRASLMALGGLAGATAALLVSRTGLPDAPRHLSGGPERPPP